MNFGIQPLMGRRAYEAEILCLHNNTYSTMFRRVEYSLTLPNHFRATGAKAFLHTSVGMATLNAYTRHCCCYIRNTNILQAQPVLGVDMPLSLSASIRGRCANQACAQEPIEPALSAQMGLPERAGPASLIGCHSASVTQRPAISQTECTLTGGMN